MYISLSGMQLTHVMHKDTIKACLVGIQRDRQTPPGKWSHVGEKLGSAFEACVNEALLLILGVGKGKSKRMPVMQTDIYLQMDHFPPKRCPRLLWQPLDPATHIGFEVCDNLCNRTELTVLFSALKWHWNLWCKSNNIYLQTQILYLHWGKPAITFFEGRETRLCDCNIWARHSRYNVFLQGSCLL